MDITLLTENELNSVTECFLFKNVSSQTVISVLGSDECTLGIYSKGQTIYSTNNYKKCFAFILSGQVVVTQPGSSEKSFIMNTLNSGDVFGAAALWSAEEDYVTILTSKQKCLILFFSQELLRKTMTENFNVTENYIAFLSDRVRFLNMKIRSLTSGSSEQSVIGHLLSVSKKTGSKTIDCGNISALAARLNIGRASLYRSLDALEIRGLIKRSGRNIELTGLELLK